VTLPFSPSVLAAGGGAVDHSLFGLITSAGHTSGLKVCLDAGALASYASGQTWLDQSASGNDFFVGATSGAEASDPTHNGTPGGLSAAEYWSFDGGDYFRYSTTNPTEFNNLHKDSAQFTVLWCLRTPSSFASGPGLFGTSGTGNVLGIDIGFVPGGGLQFVVRRTTAGQALLEQSTFTLGAGTDVLLALTVDEAAGTGAWYYGGSTEAFTSTYSSPETGAATRTAEIMTLGNAQFPMTSGGRLYGFALWEGVALSTTQIGDIDTLWTRF
jgi:hypothetical protein